MDFLGKWRVFWFQSLFRMCLPIRDLRLPGQVYRLSLLICYHCSFYFHGLMLVVLWEWKLSLLNGIWKEYKVTTGSDKIFTFSLARISFPDSVFSWFWTDWITKCGLGLAGARGCWLKGLHQILCESWLCPHSWHFHIYQIVSFVPGMSWPFYCY